MIRKIIQIDKDTCNGCGLCVTACHEGAIILEGGKATLIKDDYCDGLGDCLPVCPVDAIKFVEREAAAYDDDAVKQHLSQRDKSLNPIRQWPIQLKLVPTTSPVYQGAKLLVAADCAAFTYGNFYKDYKKDHIVMIGCPKLDNCDYTEKLTEIINKNDFNSITVLRMEVPCCKGIDYAASNALARSNKNIPYKIITISTEGEVLS